MFAFNRLSKLTAVRSAGIKAAEKQNEKIEISKLAFLPRQRTKLSKWRIFLGCMASTILYFQYKKIRDVGWTRYRKNFALRMKMRVYKDIAQRSALEANIMSKLPPDLEEKFADLFLKIDMVQGADKPWMMECAKSADFELKKYKKFNINLTMKEYFRFLDFQPNPQEVYDVLSAQSADTLSKAKNRLDKYEEYKRLTLEGKINDEMIKTFRDN